MAGLDATADPEEAIGELRRSMTAREWLDLGYAWEAMWARPNQRLPAGLWSTLFVRAGRGYGKTRTGSEGVRKLVNRGLARAVTIIAPTASDARDVMIEAPTSGLLAVHPRDTRPVYKSSNRSLEWPNGAIGHVRSAEEPDGIRGLNSDLVWGDEPASWKSGVESWDNAMLGNRIGTPHSILTGTPRPLDWLRKIEKASGTVVRTGSTYENIGNLAPTFIDLILSRYENTRLGQQELHALYLDDVEGALWTMAAIEAGRIKRWDAADPWGSLARELTLDLRRAQGLGAYLAAQDRRRWVTWVGVDPPGETAECGIVVATAPERGRAAHDHCVALDDMSVAGPPEVWGAQVVAAVHRYGADGVVVESNQGGDMVRATIHNVDPNVKVEKVRAVDSKADRAEPVSVLYPSGWVHHLGHLPKLETQQTTWVSGESKSPDRLDALVHVVTKLLRPSGTRRASVHSPV
jgi:phage terminase large subunit-like protein